MSESDHEPAFGKGLMGLVGRVVMFVFAAGLAAFLFWAYAQSWSEPPAKATGERILQILLAEAVLVMAIFCSIVALALLVPHKRLVKLVEKRGMHTLWWGVGLALVVIVATLVFVLGEL